MNFRWNYQPPTQELSEEASELSRATGLSPILCRLLIQRGIRSKAEVQKFFNPQLNELLDPWLPESKGFLACCTFPVLSIRHCFL